jgi:hypothetical protein
MSGFTHKFGVTFSNDAGTIVSEVDSYTVDSEVNLDELVAASQTNKEYDIAALQAQIKTLAIYADQACTLKFNSSGSPTPTIVLAAKKAVLWNVDHQEDNPLTTNVTKVYVTTTVATNLKIRIGIAAAP